MEDADSQERVTIASQLRDYPAAETDLSHFAYSYSIEEVDNGLLIEWVLNP